MSSAAPAPSADGVQVRPVSSKAEKKAFVDLVYRLNAGDPNWVPELKMEERGLITPGKNPWFEHGEAEFFLAWQPGHKEPVGRISAQIDQLVLEHMGAGIGQWGFLEAEDEASVKGHDHPPMVMMGHNKADYEGWVERAGYRGIKDLLTYDVPVDRPFPPIVQRIVAAGEKNPRIRIRQINKRKFDEEAALILNILNEAWSENWGFIPLTDSEIAYAGKKLKPIVLEDMILVAEYDGEPVAFMIALPDINEFLMDLKGGDNPIALLKLLWRLRKMRPKGGRVPLMGVLRKLHATRMASQLAFMMIEYIRRAGNGHYGITRSEVGWVLEDNGPMISIAQAIESRNNRIYRIYEKTL